MALTRLENNKPVEVVSAATIGTAAASWVTVATIPSGNIDGIAVILKVDINDTQNFRVRAVGLLSETATDEYALPIATAGAADVKVEDEYFELNVDADQNIIVPINLGGACPFAKIQYSAGVVGASPAIITMHLMKMVT